MKRGCGILLHVSSLPSPHGIGDMGPAACQFADMLAQSSIGYWQVLPVNPVDSQYGYSPYFSRCSFAGNPLFISLDVCAEQGLISRDELHAVPAFTPDTIDYEAVIQFKMQVLHKAYQHFCETQAQKDLFNRFCKEQAGWLEEFALFSAIKSAQNQAHWSTWPHGLANREPHALQKIRSENRGQIEQEKFYQYLFFQQWFALKKYCNERNIALVGDIPIYVSYDSVDVWTNSHIFKLDSLKRPCAVSGVPPDYFSATGQLWNTPVYNWDALKKERYAWWVQRMALTLERFDIVRIDHFRGLVQYWEVPAGDQTAMNGKWVDVPVYDFFDTMKKKFLQFPIIAEDLGVITPDVRQVMAHYHFPGMKVLQFAFGDDDFDNPYLPHNYERNSVAYTGTHDNNTTLGWLRSDCSGKEREKMYAYIGREFSPEETIEELIRIAMMSAADVVILPMQDILRLGEAARMNLPSNTIGNWKWRMTKEQMQPNIFDAVARMTEIYGRRKKTRPLQ